MLTAVCDYMDLSIPAKHAVSTHKSENGNDKETAAQTWNENIPSAACLQEDLGYAHDHLGAKQYDLFTQFHYGNLNSFRSTAEAIEHTLSEIGRSQLLPFIVLQHHPVGDPRNRLPFVKAGLTQECARGNK